MSRLLLIPTLLLGLSPLSLSAQTQEVRGRVIDGAGNPVVDQSVLLHRVIGSSGANIAQARSDSAGRFVITVDTAGGSEAVYFLAARWNDELYISEAFEAPLTAADRLLQVGVPGTSASALLEGTTATTPPRPPAAGGGSPATATRWLLFSVPTVLLIGAAVYLFLRNRGGITERRRLLARVARMDLDQAGSAAPDHQERRAELMSRLRELTGP